MTTSGATWSILHKGTLAHILVQPGIEPPEQKPSQDATALTLNLNIYIYHKDICTKSTIPDHSSLLLTMGIEL